MRETRKHAIEPLAISPFYAVADGKPNAFSKYMTAKIASELVKKGIISRNIEDLPKILEQQKFQLTGITDETSAVEFGKLASVTSMPIGEVVGSLNSSWEVNVRLIDIEKGTTIWADNFVNVEKGVIQTYLPFKLTDQYASLLNNSEKRLIHQMIRDENLSGAEKNYYINSIVSTAQIRHNLEKDPETPYLTQLARRLEQFRSEIESEEKEKLEEMRQAQINELQKERERVQNQLEAIRQNWLNSFDQEYITLENRFSKLKKIIDDSNWDNQLSSIINQLNIILTEMEKLKVKRSEMTSKKY